MSFLDIVALILPFRLTFITFLEKPVSKVKFAHSLSNETCRRCKLPEIAGFYTMLTVYLDLIYVYLWWDGWVCGLKMKPYWFPVPLVWPTTVPLWLAGGELRR